MKVQFASASATQIITGAASAIFRKRSSLSRNAVADSLIEHLQALRVETLDVLAAAKEAKDSKTMLAAVARAEAQLRLAAEMLGALQTKLHVQVRVRSFMELTEEELQFLVAEAEGHARLLPAPTQG
jgi:hypothetical protein